LNRFAVISDVHGNRWALQAVLEDIQRIGITQIVNLGDALYGPLDPAGTADILLNLDLPTVRGNEDRIIFEKDAASSITLQFVRGQLGDTHLAWLASLAPQMALDGVCLCHGTPRSDTDYLLWEVDESGARFRRSQDVLCMLADIDSPLVLCGHDHLPRTMQLPDGRMVVDPGSVGLPAYSDDQPYPHVMETGTPHARYAVVERRSHGWVVADRAVPYDLQAAVHSALQNGRPDWARWLGTGQT